MSIGTQVRLSRTAKRIVKPDFISTILNPRMPRRKTRQLNSERTLCYHYLNAVITRLLSFVNKSPLTAKVGLKCWSSDRQGKGRKKMRRSESMHNCHFTFQLKSLTRKWVVSSLFQSPGVIGYRSMEQCTISFYNVLL